jgi:hypothetical protein
MHLSEKFVGLQELAEMLGLKPDTLKRTWLQRHVRLGMPRKSAAGWLWPRRSIETWLEGNALAANDNEAPRDPPPAADAITAQNIALRQRYGGRA